MKKIIDTLFGSAAEPSSTSPYIVMVELNGKESKEVATFTSKGDAILCVNTLNENVYEGTLGRTYRYYLTENK
jgi:hypothetical protein